MGIVLRLVISPARRPTPTTLIGPFGSRSSGPNAALTVSMSRWGRCRMMFATRTILSPTAGSTAVTGWRTFSLAGPMSRNPTSCVTGSPLGILDDRIVLDDVPLGEERLSGEGGSAPSRSTTMVRLSPAAARMIIVAWSHDVMRNRLTVHAHQAIAGLQTRREAGRLGVAALALLALACGGQHALRDTADRRAGLRDAESAEEYGVQHDGDQEVHERSAEHDDHAFPDGERVEGALGVDIDERVSTGGAGILDQRLKTPVVADRALPPSRPAGTCLPSSM